MGQIILFQLTSVCHAVLSVAFCLGLPHLVQRDTYPPTMEHTAGSPPYASALLPESAGDMYFLWWKRLWNKWWRDPKTKIFFSCFSETFFGIYFKDLSVLWGAPNHPKPWEFTSLQLLSLPKQPCTEQNNCLFLQAASCADGAWLACVLAAGHRSSHIWKSSHWERCGLDIH